MPFLARLVVAALFFSALLAPLRAEESRAAAQQRIEEMVARCNGDRTCELVVRKRETAAAEKRLQRAQQDRALRESDPLSYYLRLWGRYLVFVFAVCGGAALYVLVMRRLFGRK